MIHGQFDVRLDELQEFVVQEVDNHDTTVDGSHEDTTIHAFAEMFVERVHWHIFLAESVHLFRAGRDVFPVVSRLNKLVLLLYLPLSSREVRQGLVQRTKDAVDFWFTQEHANLIISQTY